MNLTVGFRTRSRSFVLGLGLLAMALPVSAQGGPPPPLPVRAVTLPTIRESTLSNGARLVVVPQHEVPFVTVNVVVPGGSSADAPSKEGSAEFVAELLNRGTARRTGDEIARRLDRLGIALATEVSEEWTTIGLSATTLWRKMKKHGI